MVSVRKVYQIRNLLKLTMYTKFYIKPSSHCSSINSSRGLILVFRGALLKSLHNEKSLLIVFTLSLTKHQYSSIRQFMVQYLHPIFRLNSNVDYIKLIVKSSDFYELYERVHLCQRKT